MRLLLETAAVEAAAAFEAAAAAVGDAAAAEADAAVAADTAAKTVAAAVGSAATVGAVAAAEADAAFEAAGHRVGRVQSFFSSRRNWDSPHPQASVPPPPCFWGEGNTRWRERGWESPNSDVGYTLWYSLYVRTLCCWCSGCWYSRQWYGY